MRRKNWNNVDWLCLQFLLHWCLGGSQVVPGRHALQSVDLVERKGVNVGFDYFSNNNKNFNYNTKLGISTKHLSSGLGHQCWMDNNACLEAGTVRFILSPKVKLYKIFLGQYFSLNSGQSMAVLSLRIPRGGQEF